jgi:uncharacterized protein YlxW (UPF0749 family)
MSGYVSKHADTRNPRRPLGWRLLAPVAFAAAGLLAVTSMVNARGTDLRGGRHTDVIGLLSEQRADVADMRRHVRSLQADVDDLSAQVSGPGVDRLQHDLDKLTAPAGLVALHGPGLVVTLDDAPSDATVPDGTDPNLLVVHQQDIQAVVNALWAGGAEGITLQGQRIISTTGIKCVGNTVVLQGVPYSPPYRITAIGDTAHLSAGLARSPQVQNYRAYTKPPYNIGWSVRAGGEFTVPAYQGELSLDFARPADAPN